MSLFTMPVSWYMNAPVFTARDTMLLNALHHRFVKLGVSSLPVIDDSERLVGVVSRTDLLNRSFTGPSGTSQKPLLVIPNLRVIDIMTPTVFTVEQDSTVSQAAACMLEHKIHRVYVTGSDKLAGVLSARDVMPAIVDLRMERPAGDFMSTPLLVVAADEPLAKAMAMLLKTNVSGVVVLGESGPVGVFTQAEALQCRHLPQDTAVEDAMDTAVLTIDKKTPMHLVAKEAVDKNTRRIVLIDNQGVHGIVTALDFVMAAQL